MSAAATAAVSSVPYKASKSEGEARDCRSGPELLISGSQQCCVHRKLDDSVPVVPIVWSCVMVRVIGSFTPLSASIAAYSSGHIDALPIETIEHTV